MRVLLSMLSSVMTTEKIDTSGSGNFGVDKDGFAGIRWMQARLWRVLGEVYVQQLKSAG